MTIGFITIEEKAVLSAFIAVSIHFGRQTSIHRQQPGKTLIKFNRNHPRPNSPRDPFTGITDAVRGSDLWHS